MTFTPPPAGWDTFGTNLEWPGQLEFSTETDDGGMPLWERRIPAAVEKRPIDYVRVVADVTFRGEWFIPCSEGLDTVADAEAWVRDTARWDQPENILIEHRAIVHPEQTFAMSGDGERLTEYDDEIPARNFTWNVEVESIDGIYTPIMTTSRRDAADERAAIINHLFCPTLDDGEQPFARVVAAADPETNQ